MLKHDIKRLTRQSLAYSLGDFINQIINFLLLPIYLKVLTPSELGVLVLITLYGTLLRMLMRLGLNDAYLRFYFDWTEERQRRELMGNTIFVLFITNILMMIPLYLYNDSITAFFMRTDDPITISLFSTAFLVTLYDTFFRSFLNIPFTLLRAQERARSFAVLSIVRFAANMLLKILFVAILRWSVHGIVAVDLITAIFFTIVFMPQIWRNCSFRAKYREMKELLKFGLPKVPHNMSHHLLNQADRWLLQGYMTEASVGLYGLGYSLASAVKFISYAFSMAWAPYTFKTFKNQDAPYRIARISTYQMFFLLFTGLAISIFSEELLFVLDGLIMINSDWFKALDVIPYLVFAYIFQAAYFITNSGLSIAKKTKYYPIVTMSSVVVNVVMNVILIPWLGIKGAAISANISYFSLAALALFFAQKFYKIYWEWRRLLKLFLVTILLMVITSIVKIDNMAIRLLFKYVIMLAMPVLLWISGFYVKEEKEAIASRLNPSKRKIGFTSRTK